MERNALPDGFEALEPFADEWILPDAPARMQQRQAGDMRGIRAFYDTLTPLGDKALQYLGRFRLGEMPVEAENLLKLMLALAEIAPAVEWYGSTEVANGYPVSRIRYLRLIDDTAAQR